MLAKLGLVGRGWDRGIECGGDPVRAVSGIRRRWKLDHNSGCWELQWKFTRRFDNRWCLSCILECILTDGIDIESRLGKLRRAPAGDVAFLFADVADKPRRNFLLLLHWAVCVVGRSRQSIWGRDG